MITIPKITEPVFSIDEFNEPKIYKNAEAIMLLITRLVLLNPGTIQSHPTMGVGLVERYRYASETDANTLKMDISSQISKFLPQFQGVGVSVEYKNHSFYISITINEYIYMIMYDNTSEDDAIKSKYMLLSEL